GRATALPEPDRRTGLGGAGTGRQDQVRGPECEPERDAEVEEARLSPDGVIQSHAMRTAGVAISTTAHEHRLPLLAQSIIHWTRVLPESAPVVVTIDAPSEAAAELLDVFRWRTPRVEFVR